MSDELNFREARLDWKTIAILGAASAVLYAGFHYGGLPVLYGVAGLTVGYLVGYCRRQ